MRKRVRRDLALPSLPLVSPVCGRLGRCANTGIPDHTLGTGDTPGSRLVVAGARSSS